MSWEDNDFSDADKAEDVLWMIMYWRTVPCHSGCKGNYQMESRQFDHLVKAATREEALERFQSYVANRRESGFTLASKNHCLFLCKVDTMVRISDETGVITHD